MEWLCFLWRGREIVWLRLSGIEMFPTIMEERRIIFRRNPARIRAGRRLGLKTGGIFFFESRFSFRKNRIDLRTKRCLAVGRRREWLVFACVSGLTIILIYIKGGASFLPLLPDSRKRSLLIF